MKLYFAVGVTCAVVIAGCGDATRPPATGEIGVRIVTSGPDANRDGYVVFVDGKRQPPLVNDAMILPGVSVGAHDVWLNGLGTNCRVDAGESRRVNVVAGELANVNFDVACVARVGEIAASVTTTGEVPAAVYNIAINASADFAGDRHPIHANDTTTIPGISEGTYKLSLVDLPANCSVAGMNPALVTVTFRQTTKVDFNVLCAPTHTIFRITTTTTGPDPDPDGYRVRVANWPKVIDTSIAVNDVLTLDVPVANGYIVSLAGVAPNCFIDSRGFDGTVRRVDVYSWKVDTAAFVVSCDSKPNPRRQPTGQLAFSLDGQIHRVNADGTGLVRLTQGPSDNSPAWSPDGKRIAFVRYTGQFSDIYVMDADGSNVVRRTRGGFNHDPAWSPDGKRIAFARFPGEGSTNLYVMSATDDGSEPRMIVDLAGWEGQPAWHPDGSMIAFASDWAFYDFLADIYTIKPDGTGFTQVTNKAAAAFNTPLFYQPAWSPDGRKLAAVNCEPTLYSCDVGWVVVMNADGSELVQLVHALGFARPTWSPDGQTIAYASQGPILWISADGSDRGMIVERGYSPAWRPIPGSQSIRRP